jgi:hypothetical protein
MHCKYTSVALSIVTDALTSCMHSRCMLPAQSKMEEVP